MHGVPSTDLVSPTHLERLPCAFLSGLLVSFLFSLAGILLTMHLELFEGANNNLLFRVGLPQELGVGLCLLWLQEVGLKCALWVTQDIEFLVDFFQVSMHIPWLDLRVRQVV